MDLHTVLAQQAQKHESFYLYDEGGIRSAAGRLGAAFPGVDFLYSIKCNPHPRVVEAVFGEGFGADAASLGEVLLSQKLGAAPGQIFYSAPGKTDDDLTQAMGKCTIIADSLGELERLEALAARQGQTLAVGVRINPDFSFAGEGGAPSKFGIDEGQLYPFLAEGRCPHLSVTGIHVHLKSQELNPGVLAAYYGRMAALAQRVSQALGHSLEYVNMGSGIGIPYAEGDIPLNVDALGEAARQQLQAFRRQSPGTRIIIEVGRYAVGNHGVYVTHVVDKKVSQGRTYLILKNTLNGFLRPSLARLVCKYAGEAVPAGAEPLFTAPDAFQFRTLKQDGPLERVSLVGNLCTAADVIAEEVELPRLEVGDVVYITNAGSYAAVLSPMQFSSQEPPKELFLTREGLVLE